MGCLLPPFPTCYDIFSSVVDFVLSVKEYQFYISVAIGCSAIFFGNRFLINR